ncbi:copper-translocating P-type ATPase [Rhodococcus sp. HNM0563]|uniref:copper-translocating P-type ATPase n=2 Tax=unclassified Rhodococcus (in: high G+C Gram-positive bacteria) TaxID=192944 RepID=UPI00146F0F10|nr:copper-translocating P-type ATPase [Rhodococcus sp. HNM0563]
MSHPEHEHSRPSPAGHDHATFTQSRRYDERDPRIGPGEHNGHDKHAGHGAHGEMFRRRFWISLILSIPVVAFSHMVADLLGYHIPDFPGSMWIPPVLGTVIFVYGGSPFLTGAWSELRSRQPGMMLLIGMAITVAFVASWITTLELGGFDLDFWWELALLIVIMLLGHWLEMRALGSASGALDALAAMLPDTAEKITDEGNREVPLTELSRGDLVLVRAGARMPADGTVVDGRAEVDEAMITGESKTVTRESGDTVVAGTVATDSTLRVRVTAVGQDTALAGIQRMVADAQASSSRAQALADKAAAFLFYFAATAGILTFAVWSALGNVDEAVVRTVTVLVIACPHALGLAIPLVIAISTERAAKAGVLVKDRLSLERMRTVDVVLFDKTGTLTRGRHQVTGVAATAEVSETHLLAVAAAVESDSEHPVAHALVTAAEARVPGDQQLIAADFRSLPGRGVRATIDGSDATVGGPTMLSELGLSAPEDVTAVTDGWVQRGASVLHVAHGGRVLGAVALEDAVREESRQAIDALHARGVKVAMITGDAQQVADAVAADLGIDEVFAQVLPERKDAEVAALQDRGHKVAMVGDGVNDAPALARADVGVAIGAGTDVAIESAGVVLAANDPRAVLSIIELSHASYRKMWQNLIWAAGYNIVAVPLAAGVLAFAGVAISPAVAAVLMSVSTIVVALNAQLLRRLDLDPAQLGQAGVSRA